MRGPPPLAIGIVAALAGFGCGAFVWWGTYKVARPLIVRASGPLIYSQIRDAPPPELRPALDALGVDFLGRVIGAAVQGALEQNLPR